MNPDRPLRGARRQSGWAAWRVIRGILAAVTLVGVVVGVPWTLLQFTHWPITGLPAWDQIANFPAIAAEDTTIAAIFTVGMWLAWGLFTACVVVEIVGEIRGTQAARLPMAAPFQGLARTLVASAAMTLGSLSPLGGSGAGAGGQMPRAAATAVAVAQPVVTGATATTAPLQPADAPTGDTAESPVQWRTVTVRHGDTAWELAELHYGDGTDWLQMWEDNRHELQPDGRTWNRQADPIEAGWRLRIREDPTGQTAAEPSARSAPDASQAAQAGIEAVPAPNPRPAAAPTEITVEPGDNFWCIAQDHLERVGGRPATHAEIEPYWLHVIEANRARLADPDNPDLIYAGQRFVLPALDPSTAPDPAAPTPEPPAPAEPSQPPEAGPRTTGTAPPATEHSASTASPTPRDAPSSIPRDTRPEAPPTDGDERPGTAPIAVPAGISAALATVALRALARRRRSRRRSVRPGSTTEPRPAADVTTELALARAGGDVLARAWHAATTLGPSLHTTTAPPTLAGLVVRPNGDVILHLSEPAVPVAPFVQIPGDPSSWRLPGDDTTPELDDEGVPPLETLVSLGCTADDEWVFVDLETLGAICIDGNREHAKALAQSLAAELALQPLNRYINTTVVGGLTTPETVEQGVAALGRLDDDTVRRMERLAEDTAALLAVERTASTATARVQGVPRDGLFVEVLVVDAGADPVLLDRVAGAAVPGGRCIGVLALDPLDPPATQLVANDDGTLDVPHLGLTVYHTRLDPNEMDRVDDLLRRETDMGNPSSSTSPPTRAVTADNGEIAPYEEPAWDYRVSVFADLRVETPDGAAIPFREADNPDTSNRHAHRGPELLAYLALRPDRAATLHEIAEHLWWGRRIGDRTVANLISATRSTLGGRSYLSHADRETDHHYQLAPTVVTDHALLSQALDYARAVADTAADLALAALQPHLATIRAKPFRDRHLGSGLAEWAAASRLLDQIEEAVIDAALVASRLHTTGNGHGPDNALPVIDQALTACPTNELLVRTAMELETQAGRAHAAERRYQALAVDLARDDLEPEDETTELRRRLTSRRRRIG
jgi:nucleoid-associated protein YgaU